MAAKPWMIDAEARVILRELAGDHVVFSLSERESDGKSWWSRNGIIADSLTTKAIKLLFQNHLIEKCDTGTILSMRLTGAGKDALALMDK